MGDGEWQSPLFADMGAESDLSNEIRLSELWDLCEMGCLSMEEFFELSALIGGKPQLEAAIELRALVLHASFLHTRQRSKALSGRCLSVV